MGSRPERFRVNVFTRWISDFIPKLDIPMGPGRDEKRIAGPSFLKEVILERGLGDDDLLGSLLEGFLPKRLSLGNIEQG
ncbi:MAG: hypothetical protein ACYCYP_12430 [Leptospirales bacterium]